MNEMHKEMHRILNLAIAIDEAEIRAVTFERKSHIQGLTVEVFEAGKCRLDRVSPEFERTVYLDWDDALPRLIKVRRELEQVLKAGKAKVMEVAA